MHEDYSGKEMAGASGTAFWEGIPSARPRKEPFQADRKDGIFALAAFILGFFSYAGCFFPGRAGG